jgi:hypothetical protein
MWGKMSTNDCFKLHIYLHTKKSYTIPNIHFTIGGNIEAIKDAVQLQEANVSGRAKPIRIFGSHDN